MEYMGDERFWDEKFANRNGNLLSPEKSLVDHVEYFKESTVLDIACGDGRNSLFLLEKGFQVTGVDFSSKALERLEMFANLYLIRFLHIQYDMPNIIPLKTALSVKFLWIGIVVHLS